MGRKVKRKGKGGRRGEREEGADWAGKSERGAKGRCLFAFGL